MSRSSTRATPVTFSRNDTGWAPGAVRMPSLSLKVNRRTRGPLLPAEQRYDWERFWLEPEARLLLVADDFFPDPKAGATWMRPSVAAITLAEESSTPCLVLLGEPGLGKSQAVKDADRALDESPEKPLHQRIDLGAYSDAGSIRAKLIEGEPWREWVADGRTFHLFLDSADEAMLQFPAVGDFLIEELRAAPGSLSNLRLRVACRSADWTSDLTDGLKELWEEQGGGGEAVRELSLAPLREVDLRSAAIAEGLDVDALVQEIRERDLESLASLPLTASMLLGIAKEDSALPETRLDLYSRGVATLLREDNRRRRRVEGATFSAAERLRIAKCLGAGLLISRHHAIGLTPLRAGRGEIDPAEFEGLRIPRSATDPTSLTLGDRQLFDTLSTALFVKVGPDAVTFAHRSLAEFCAGACLAGSDRDAVFDLLFVDEAKRRLIPQLREVAAWAAAQSPDMLASVLASEPEVLLRVDRLDLPESQRVEVIAALLNVESAERLSRWDRRIWRSLSSLKHRDIADQLGPVILDPDRHWSVRQLAITIIRACEVEEAESALLDLARSPSEPAWMRDDAVWALREFGSSQSREALVPLALETIEDDVDDEIKGGALAAIFPEFVSAERVLESLTPPRNRNLIGAYSSFLHRGFAESLAAKELPAALRWVRALPVNHDRVDRLQGLADEIIARAWPMARDSEEIAGLLAAVVMPRLRAHVGMLTTFIGEERREVILEPEARRRVVESLVPLMPDEGIEAVSLMVSSPRLIQRADLSWALRHLEVAVGAKDEDTWADVVRFAVAAPLTGGELEDLYALTTANPRIRERAGFLLMPIELDSELAKSLRENYEANTEADKQLPDRRAEMDRDVDGYLDQFEAGDEEAWWLLNWVLQFDDGGQGLANVDFEPDLTTFPGWKRATEERRDRIIAAAQTAIESSPPDVDTWFGTNTINRPAAAGYRALYLIALLNGGSTQGISPDSWTRWMPIAIDFPRFDSTEQRLHDDLLRSAAAGDPSAFTDWSIRKLDAEERENEGHLWFLRRIEGFAPQALLSSLISRLAGPQVRPQSMTDLLTFLLETESEATVRAVRPRLEAARAVDLSEGAKDIAARIAAALLGGAPGVAWREVAALFDANPEVGRDSVAALTTLERNSVATTMPDDHLAAFTTWVYREFPESGDPPIESEAHYVGPRESIGQFRTGLLNALCERGTGIAVRAVEMLYEKHESVSLRFAARRAREVRDSRTPAPSAGDVLRVLAGDSRQPLDAGDLERIVLQALNRIQRSLQTSQPAASPELWNTRPTNTPKDEGELSNWLIRRLEAELGPELALTRESLLRGGGKGRGKSGDILVTAPSPKGDERLRLLIEVKGSWEANVQSRMNTQLASEYMDETGITHAIYLVFWFDRSKWDSNDYRYAKSTFKTAEAARDFFDDQATTLSQRGRQVRAMVLDGSLT
jgi:HEAT repeats